MTAPSLHPDVLERAPTRSYPSAGSRQYTNESSVSGSLQNQGWSDDVTDARGNNGRTVDGENTANSGRVSTAELVDFVKEQASRRSIKEVSRLTGLSEKAVANLRTGASGASAQTISTWCRQDPVFRAEYFRWCGGILEGTPEMYIALSRAINETVRLHSATARREGGE